MLNMKRETIFTLKHKVQNMLMLYHAIINVEKGGTIKNGQSKSFLSLKTKLQNIIRGCLIAKNIFGKKAVSLMQHNDENPS